MKTPIVVLGSGLAGITVIRELRKIDKEIPVILVTADDGGFYSKPNLSNAFATNKTAAQLAMTPKEKLAEQLNIKILNYTKVTEIDPRRRQLHTPIGPLGFGTLVIALGANPIRLPLTGSGADDVLSVNDLNAYAVFRDKIEGKKSIAILGGGLIGCEFANDLVIAGFEPTVFDISPQPLGRLLPAGAGAFFKEKLMAAGVKFENEVSINQVDKTAVGYTLIDSRSGKSFHADIVLSAVGLRSETSMAQKAGLQVNRGLIVDQYLQTSEEHIYALGDCAEVSGLVLPFVMPIMAAARALAKTLSGEPTKVVYPAMPVGVKTPACSAVVCPPPANIEGSWQESATDDGYQAIFLDKSAVPVGFALLGSATAEKQALAAKMPAWL